MIKLEVIGNLGANAALFRNNDRAFISFRIADSRKIFDQETGVIDTRTTWVSCTKEGKNENLLPYLKTGAKVYVRGNASVRIYQGNDGKKHAGINCSVTELELCGGKKEKEEEEEESEAEKDDEPF